MIQELEAKTNKCVPFVFSNRFSKKVFLARQKWNEKALLQGTSILLVGLLSYLEFEAQGYGLPKHTNTSFKCLIYVQFNSPPHNPQRANPYPTAIYFASHGVAEGRQCFSEVSSLKGWSRRGLQES